MIDSAGPDPSAVLLRQLRDDPKSEEAWRAFVDRYERLILRWCRRRGLQPADAEDVTQDVMLAMMRQLPTFIHDPSRNFDGWLRRIADRIGCRLLNQRHRRGIVGAVHLARDADRGDFLNRLGRDGDLELLDEAMACVRRRVSARTWQVFIQTALEDRTGLEVAARLRIKVGTVFVARSRVQRLLREELVRLDPSMFVSSAGAGRKLDTRSGAEPNAGQDGAGF